MNPDDVSHNFTDACISGDLAAIKEIAANFPELCRNINNLGMAVAQGHFEVVKYLVEHGAAANEVDDWPLRWSVIYNYSDVINYLRRSAKDKWLCNKCLIRSTCREWCHNFRNG